YQWRGSDVENILGFAKRYPDVATFEISTNRRSRPELIEVANRFARTIPERIEKEMQPDRPSVGSEPELVVWHADSEAEEAGWIANLILDLHEKGQVRFRDIAVLVRSSAAYPRLVEQFQTFDIPVQPAGRTGLFDQPEAIVLGQTFAWLTDVDWRGQYGPGEALTGSGLLDEYERVFRLDGATRNRLKRFLPEWKDFVPRTNRTADLVGELYLLLQE